MFLPNHLIKERDVMKKYIQMIAIICLILGTLGLLLNEFLFSWGRPVTLIFAAVNIIGLVMLGFSFRKTA